MSSANNQIYRLADVEVDALSGCLRRDGQESYLREQTLQVFRYLVEHRTQTVTKEDLINNVWQGMAVTDDALVQCIVEIRKALGDDSRHPHFIKTIPKIGYRFIGPVELPKLSELTTIHTEEITSVQVEEEVTLEDDDTPTADLAVSSAALLPHRAVFPASKGLRVALVIGFVLILGATGGFLVRFQEGLWPSKQQLAKTTLPQVPGKKAVAVMFFENRSGGSELDWLREGLGDMVITDLSRSTKLIVLNRQQLHLLLDRIGHKQGDRIQLEEALEIARRSRAEAIVLGSFVQLGEKVRIDAQLHDAGNGQLLAVESMNADSIEQILTQVDLLSLKLAGHLGAAQNEQKRTGLADVMTDSLEAYRYYSLALERAQAYHTLQAISLWEKAIALDPQFAMAYARIGYTHALIRVNEVDKSKPYLEKAFQLSHRLTEKDKLHILAWYAFVNEGRGSAIRAFRALIARYPQEVEAYLRLGYLLRYEGHWEEATDEYKQGLAVDPENQHLYNALGFSCSGLGRYDEAIAAHQSYVQLAPHEPNAHDSLGMTYKEAGRYEEALDEFDRALALDPEFHFAKLHLADVHFRLGRYRAAIRQYRRFLQFAPSDWDRAVGHHRLALLYWKKGDLARAQAAANQELKYYKYFGGAFLIALERGDFHTANKLRAQIFDNSNEESLAILGPKRLHFWRGYYALRTGRASEAIDEFREALRDPPLIWNVDGVEDCLANAYLELGQLDEAIAEYERILRLNPNYPLAHYHLGQAYERKAQADQARAAYQRFLQVWGEADADIPEVLIAKRRLAT